MLIIAMALYKYGRPADPGCATTEKSQFMVGNARIEARSETV
jgi:hypothetical protein